MNSPDKLSLVVFSGGFERVHYALCMAAAAAASNRPVTLFFTMGASRALCPQGWHDLPLEQHLSDERLQSQGIVGFEEILESCIALNVTFMVCEMGLRALGLTTSDLRSDIPLVPGGIVSFLADASAAGAMLFI